MIGYRIVLDSQRKLDRLKKNIARMEQRLHNAVQGRRGRLANRALSQLTREPGKPIYPLRWKSARQRRAFFASDGFGRGIPTRRTGALQAGWDVQYQRQSDGGLLVLFNSEDYMTYVQGSRAQPFHEDTGWVQVADVMDDFYKEAGDNVVIAFYEDANPLEGMG